MLFTILQTREQHVHLRRQQAQYECGDEWQEEEDAYSDGAEDQVRMLSGRTEFQLESTEHPRADSTSASHQLRCEPGLCTFIK
jgi:hypothetical protein